MHKLLAATFAVAAAFSLTYAGPASAATLQTSGEGWKLTSGSPFYTTSVSPTKTYTVTYQSDAVKKFYAPQIQRAVDQINSTTGLHLEIGGVEPMDPDQCGPDYHIQVMELHNPIPAHPGWSQGLPCPNPPGGMSRGGVVAMNDTYRSGESTISPEVLQDTAAHEVLHTLGLDHPNKDLNGDGTVADGECVATSYGNKPIMCSPNGGYHTWSNVGKLTGYDVNGINALLNNAKIQGIS